MNAFTLLSQLEKQGVALKHLTADSRQVQVGSVFLAYPGEHQDGRKYIEQAISKGAAAVLWESENYTWSFSASVLNQPVSGLKNVAGELAHVFYQSPSDQLWMIGITGTNGKTSCSHWLAETLTMLGRKSATIGTLGNGFSGNLGVAINTTPDPIILHGLLAEYLAQGAQAVTMEVSSHGLDQGRVNGVKFDVAVFTNLSRDHLDYHNDMQSYAAAKKKLFAWPDLQAAVINADDDFGATWVSELRGNALKVLSYGLESGADVRGSDLQLNHDGLAMHVETPYGSALLKSSVIGRFNAYNLLAVLATLLVSGVTLDVSVAVISKINPVEGRMQRFGQATQPMVVVDYAHTPDALEKVLNTLRDQTQGRLICVFGCGGNRDAGKRPLMGAVATRLADLVFLTSDNPRNENLETIIADTLSGMAGQYSVVVDRRQAIHEAIKVARANDVVLVAGKGHESYQEIAGVKYPFSDVAEVKQSLSVWGSLQ